MLLYSLLYLTGYDLTLDDLKRFRQLGSRTPGHPEYGLTPGVEATTGPLGQGVANAVGMAIAETHLAAEFNRQGHTVVDHWTYTICSDGDMQEGVASEAASLAGRLRLGKLIALYDDNHVQLDGPTDWAFTEDVLERFDAYAWDTRRVEDGNDTEAIAGAIDAARQDPRPSLIAVRTHIGYGSPHRQDSSKAHGQALGEEEVRLTKEAYGWDPDRHFYVPDEARRLFREAIPRGEAWVRDWEARLDAYRTAYPREAAELERRLSRRLPDGWDRALPSFGPEQGQATRQASQAAIQAVAARLPELFGGAADLSESTLTDIADGGRYDTADRAGRNIRFGVREHAMGGIANGLAYHGGVLPYAGTFLTFSDYMRGSVRLAALSGLHVIYVWTHDSIGLGEDGPTHEPVEQVAALRAIPNLWVMRPGDANETVAAWRAAVARTDGPVALALSRQKLPVLEATRQRASEGVARGGYVLVDAADAAGQTVPPRLLILATGSELQHAVAAREQLQALGAPTRVVSMPCWELFEMQPAEYRNEVLPPTVTARVSIEAGVSFGWDRWVGPEGAMVSVERFGLSGPGPQVMEAFGITAQHLVEVAQGVLEGRLHGVISVHTPGEPAGAGAD
jgi:transketolase